MNGLIEEQEYLKLVKLVPIFCVDFLIKCKGKYLLIKRVEEPGKDLYWVVGGRLRFKETIDEFAKRVQTREIGRHFSQRKLIAFSNYMFPENENSRATHTPAIMYLVEIDDFFVPDLDETSIDYIWAENLPEELLKITDFIYEQ